jgi:hypothetical protein
VELILVSMWPAELLIKRRWHALMELSCGPGGGSSLVLPILKSSGLHAV